MELEVNKSTSTATQWGVIIIVIIVFLLIVWLFSSFIQNKGTDKSFMSKFSKKSAKGEPETVQSEKVIEYLKSNSSEKLDNSVKSTSNNVENLDTFKANVLAAHNVLLNYVNTVNNLSQPIFNNQNIKWSKKKVENYQEDVAKAKEYLKWIETKLGELNNIDPANTKQVKKYVHHLTKDVRKAYNKVDDVQYDLDYFYDELFSYALVLNLSQEEYLALVQPVLATLQFTYDTHQSLNASPNSELKSAYENAVNEINKKRTKIPVSRIDAINNYYQKANKNFVNWWKVNIENDY